METIKKLLDDVKKATNVDTDYALAKALDLPRARIHDYYKGNRTPDQFACLKIAVALKKPLEEIVATVEIAAEKNEKRREEWKRYYKSIGGYAASFMLVVFAFVTFIVTTPNVSAKESMTYDTSIPRNTNYAFIRAKIKAAISIVLNMLSSAFQRFCFSG